MSVRRTASVLVCAVLAVAGSFGAAKAQTAVKVGSKNFTESILAAHMMADVLEAAGIKVERKVGLGGTGVIHQALVAGEIDTYPEYTGTALLVQLKLPVNNDPAVDPCCDRMARRSRS